MQSYFLGARIVRVHADSTLASDRNAKGVAVRRVPTLHLSRGSKDVQCMHAPQRGATAAWRSAKFSSRSRRCVRVCSSAEDESFFLGVEENADGTTTFLFGSKDEFEAAEANKSAAGAETSTKVDIEDADIPATKKKETSKPAKTSKATKVGKTEVKPKAKGAQKNASSKGEDAVKVAKQELAQSPATSDAADVTKSVTKRVSKMKSAEVSPKRKTPKAKDPTVDSARNHEDLSALKVIQLRDIAREKGLKGYSKLKKADLVQMLSTIN
ncbi:hypothetical protein CYMTET_41652 [Cymbomonas tetramitiformis]|uniref:Rho termination factor-like N-terminal domain-containing protein n=1 Tax=Cymbomonas tetramitiformis TaxID=36881 RepID=A0AAE0F2F3_9CHLO|nr:hypothetical protein CYMTET_41652 [Cymbomonas tetramitiformis]